MDRWLELAGWREQVARLYMAEPRAGEAGLEAFRRGRDRLFREHPQSPLTPEQRASFQTLPWFAYSPQARVQTRLEPVEQGEDLLNDTAGDRTYGAGRYLTDTIKGTFGRALQVEGDRITLDFNYAYNPSCAYDSRWACPLPPSRTAWTPLSPPASWPSRRRCEPGRPSAPPQVTRTVVSHAPAISRPAPNSMRMDRPTARSAWTVEDHAWGWSPRRARSAR